MQHGTTVHKTISPKDATERFWRRSDNARPGTNWERWGGTEWRPVSPPSCLKLDVDLAEGRMTPVDEFDDGSAEINAKRIANLTKARKARDPRRKQREPKALNIPVMCVRDPRLPAPGEVLARVWGKDPHLKVEHVVMVHEFDFEYVGKRYRSLSRIAQVITGKVHNGFVFFGLTARPTKKPAPAAMAAAS